LGVDAHEYGAILDAREAGGGGAGFVDVVYVAVSWVVGLEMLVLFLGEQRNFKEKLNRRNTYREEVKH
jgi:hypothetical protein